MPLMPSSAAELFKLKEVTVSQPCSGVRWAKSPTGGAWTLQLENLGGKSEPALGWALCTGRRPAANRGLDSLLSIFVSGGLGFSSVCTDRH